MKPNENFREGRRDETLLMEGKYREWFWKGLGPESVKFLKTPSGDEGNIRTYLKCRDCGLKKPRASFNIGVVGTPGRPGGNRCNKCVLANPAHSKQGRWENTQPVGWEDKASCDGADPEVFFPQGTTEYRKKDAPWREFCPECPVKELCEQFAIQSRSLGVFGGKYFYMKSNTITMVDEHTAKPIGRPRKAA